MVTLLALIAYYLDLSYSTIFISLIIIYFFTKKLNSLTKKTKSLSNQVIFLTNGASHIGKHLAIQLSRLGAKISIVDQDLRAANSLVTQILSTENEAIAIQCDISDKTSIEKAIKQTVQVFGPITILINNSDTFFGKSLLNTSIDQSEYLFNVNFFSYLQCIKEIIPDMIRNKKGHIVSVASVSSFVSFEGFLDYSGSKHAVKALMDGLRKQLDFQGQDFIKTTTIFPWFVNTNRMRNLREQPQQVLEPENVARVIVSGILDQEVQVVICPGLVKCILFVDRVSRVVSSRLNYWLNRKLSKFYFNKKQQQQI